MDLSLSTLLSLARFTIQNPREGARMVMGANMPIGARWVALALMAVVSAILAHLAFALMPLEVRQQMAGAMSSPVTSAVMQGALMLGAVFVIHYVGRWRGGVGRFEDALILMIWLQFILLILQVVQIVTQVLLPPLSVIVGYASVGIFLWLLSNFVAELHGFKSVLMTFFGVLLALLAIGFVLAIVLIPFIAPGM
ncbi:MAG: Yip1 family protein [Pseudotabrizicola sp.]|uniref:Yip1 family protein n=1 Tax=Pseudotabrizicola sp. TaxID=2939647 RepID=UPI00271D6762|nr:Yip1 family protein [Pseudotabrizicola sp.]MDO8885151.1 Yip1 family protein [Pseudotabrizicola sp.]MDP2082654.1 Yip1 family protein [Pseudotabrizicola sp.]MDZ7573550.1 Yip1 family protein [Pseudotabrizicola sp.]